MRSGGKPSSAAYSTAAPSRHRASTRMPMGRWRIRSVPVMVCVPGVMLRYAVRNRIAVPAAMMSITSGIVLNARSMTCVSSQSERFLTSGTCLAQFRAASVWMTSARLLILLLAGSCACTRSLSGGYIMIRIDV